MILPLQGAEYREHLYPGCYPGLYDKRLSALGYSIINFRFSLLRNYLDAFLLFHYDFINEQERYSSFSRMSFGQGGRTLNQYLDIACFYGFKGNPVALHRFLAAVRFGREAFACHYRPTLIPSTPYILQSRRSYLLRHG